MKYTVIVEKGRESGYVAFCPMLKGCVAQGRTEKSALSHLQRAMEDYIECLVEDGLPVPVEVGVKIIKVGIKAHEQAA
ncbi:MAG: type II toxin-antitoxin system HicB family antitoxin [bacterium]